MSVGLRKFFGIGVGTPAAFVLCSCSAAYHSPGVKILATPSGVPQQATEVSAASGWSSILDKGRQYDVFLDPITNARAVLVRPAMAPREFDAGPSGFLEFPDRSFRFNALSLDPAIARRLGNQLLLSAPGDPEFQPVPIPKGSWVSSIAFSPLGNWVSFITHDGAVDQLWVAAVYGEQVRPVSSRSVNLFTSGQESYRLNTRHRDAVPYLWLPDESGLVFTAKSDRNDVSPGDWAAINPPTVGSSQSERPFSPRREFVAQEEASARRLLAELALSRTLVRAPVTASTSEAALETDASITHLIRRGNENSVTIATLEYDDEASMLRHLQGVVPEGKYLRAGNKVLIPESANWPVLPGAGSSVLGIVRTLEERQECLLAVTGLSSDPPPFVCFGHRIDELSDLGDYLLIRSNRAKYDVVDKASLVTVYDLDVTSFGGDLTHALGSTGGARCPTTTFAYIFVNGASVSSLSKSAAVEALPSQPVSNSAVLKLEFGDMATPAATVRLTPVDDNTSKNRRFVCDGRLVGTTESRNEPVNFHLFDLQNGEQEAITFFEDGEPDFASLERMSLEFSREDGVPLSAELIIPKNDSRRVDGRYPVVIWQYPAKYASRRDWEIRQLAGGAAASGSLRWSQRSDEYLRPTGERYIGSWLPYLLAYDGYAVVAYPDFPLIGVDGNEEFGFYGEQQARNAQAIVDNILSTGRIDPARIAVGGHSRGGQVATALIASTDLFAAGFTFAAPTDFFSSPFGFQYEDRTYWDESSPYVRNSVILQVNEIKKPLLIMHGADDNHPVVSDGEDLYSNIVQAGGVSRLVVYPDTGHVPIHRETQLSILREVSRWLDMHMSTD